jgi:hypothetical protein
VNVFKNEINRFPAKCKGKMNTFKTPKKARLLWAVLRGEEAAQGWRTEGGRRGPGISDCAIRVKSAFAQGLNRLRKNPEVVGKPQKTSPKGLKPS